MSANDDFEQELQLLLDAWDNLDIDTQRLRARLQDIGALETAKEYVRRETGGLIDDLVEVSLQVRGIAREAEASM